MLVEMPLQLLPSVAKFVYQALSTMLRYPSSLDLGPTRDNPSLPSPSLPNNSHPFSPPSFVSDANDFIRFVIRVLQQTRISFTAVVLSLYYIRMLNSKVLLHSHGGSGYRIWLTSLALADDYLNDNTYTCKSWSIASGFPAKECVLMKQEFLKVIDFRLHVETRDYHDWFSQCQGLLQHSWYDSSMLSSPWIQTTPAFLPRHPETAWLTDRYNKNYAFKHSSRMMTPDHSPVPQAFRVHRSPSFIRTAPAACVYTMSTASPTR
jgi:hypothetical protein